ncbi:MAG: DUF92 domain-containing protein [Gemmatimonadetes bacterium]|nr:DUF92 domain-containing protein [Gemmatimonadota bacterium]
MKWLTGGGLATAGAVGAAVTAGLGWQGLALLFAFFLSGSVLTQLTGGAGGRRNVRQVIANGGAAALAALAGFWTVAAGALAAATADTWATEIGSYSPTPPRLITTGVPVSHGASGGITPLGTAGGVAGAVFLAALAWVLAPAAAGSAIVAGAGVAGMLADSLLGATVQGLYECPACGAQFERGGAVCHEPVQRIRGWAWLDNDGVNLAATLVGAGVAALGWRLSR